jgi:hypothetical protein
MEIYTMLGSAALAAVGGLVGLRLARDEWLLHKGESWLRNNEIF